MNFDLTEAGPLLESLLLKQAALEHQLARLDAQPGEVFSFSVSRDVSAGETFRVPLAVAQPGTTIAYEFSVAPAGYDIGFDVVRPGAEEAPARMVPPPLAGPGFSTEAEVNGSPALEVATVAAARAGTHVLVFDNSHSMFTPKSVACRVRLLEPLSRPAHAAHAWLALTPAPCARALALRGALGARARVAANDVAAVAEVEARAAQLEGRRAVLLQEQLARTARMRGLAPDVMAHALEAQQAAQQAAAVKEENKRFATSAAEGGVGGEGTGKEEVGANGGGGEASAAAAASEANTAAKAVEARAVAGAGAEAPPAVVATFEVLKCESEACIAQIERLRQRLLQLEGAHAALLAAQRDEAAARATGADSEAVAALAEDLRACLARCPLKES
jgi:hypothetical protein